MSAKKSSSMRRVREALDNSGLSFEVVELPQSTRTAQEAADAVGCELGQIVKSLVFRGEASDRPYLVLVSGPNRADVARLRKHVGEAVEMADADFVRAQTGFSIGGVAPVGLLRPVETLIDEDLLAYDEIWAAAGTPSSVFRLDPRMLERLSDGRVVAVA